jgi:hypothetical protein
MAVARHSRSAKQTTGPMLVFYRAPRELIRPPGDVVSLLNDAGVETATVQGRNPVTHDEWLIPVISLATAGLPYAQVFAGVAKTWLQERKGRQVRLENGRSRITANTPEDAIRLLTALTKHEKEIAALHVTKSRKAPTKRAAKKGTRK